MGDVTLTDITKRYDNLTAVDEMNIEVENGEFVTLVGPSGCGKSTTLDTIAGLTMPTSGTITIAGREVTDQPPKDRKIAMVFQNIALFPHMDVYDNISFGLRLRDFEKSEVDRRVEDAVNIVQLEGMLDRMPDELSGGQRQRVAIARAIVRQPEVFLMDEPLANLDAKLRVHMRTELQRLHKELETTIIYVTHDQAEAMTMSDRIAVINDGRLQQIAPPLTCYNEPANTFVAGFIGSPSMNLIDGVVTADGVTTDSFDLVFDASAAGLTADDRVEVGVRPEDVYLAEETDLIDHPSAPFEMQSDVLEPMGDEIFVYLQSVDGEGEKLLMSVDPDVALDEDQHVQVVVDRSNVHLFAPDEEGDALAHGVVEIAAERTTPVEGP